MKLKVFFWVILASLFLNLRPESVCVCVSDVKDAVVEAVKAALSLSG